MIRYAHVDRCHSKLASVFLSLGETLQNMKRGMKANLSKEAAKMITWLTLEVPGHWIQLASVFPGIVCSFKCP